MSGVPDVRIDPLTGDEVVVAPGRAARPDTFRAALSAPLPPTVATCPFCPGNEHETPPEVARTGEGEPDTPGWRVRVVPNLYPIVPGAHEVVILSPAHDHALGDLEDDAVRELFSVVRDRVRHQYAAGCAHVQAFVNHGRAAGASIEHPHAQIIGLPTMPPRVAGFRDALAAEIGAVRGTPLMLRDGDIAAWCPPAAVVPFMTRCGAATGGAPARFDALDDGATAVLAVAVRDAVRGITDVLGDIAYNVIVEQGPRWWVDIVPRVTVLAGFEIATGVFVNPIAPEDAAAALRRTP